MKPKRKTTQRNFRADVRKAVADYMGSEGCDCCQGSMHGFHEAMLAKLLNVPKYPDGSGFDFGRFRSKP